MPAAALLAQKAVLRTGLTQEVRGENLDRHLARELGIVSLNDAPHASPAEHLLQLIMSQHSVGRHGHLRQQLHRKGSSVTVMRLRTPGNHAIHGAGNKPASIKRCRMRIRWGRLIDNTRTVARPVGVRPTSREPSHRMCRFQESRRGWNRATI